MILPTSTDLMLRQNLVPLHDLCDRLEEAIAAVEKHQRGATVTVTYKVGYDHETDTIDVVSTVKAKRPVRTNRNEEVLGEEETILRLRRAIPGQQNFVEDLAQNGLAKAADDLAEADRKLEAAGASMTLETGDGTKVTLGKGRRVEKPAKAAAKKPAKAKA